MKKINKIVLLTSITGILLLSGCTAYSGNEQGNRNNQRGNEQVQNTATTTLRENASTTPGNYGSLGAMKDESLTLEEMLRYAIEDEYLAQAEYQYATKQFGDQNPFTNIIDAEQTHIDALKVLYKAYNLPVPENKASEHLISLTNVNQGFEAGVQAEINNIAMYEKFLAQKDLPNDVKTTFTSLRDGSKNHLEAFQNKVSNSNGQGNKQGGGQGNGKGQGARDGQGNGSKDGQGNGPRDGKGNGSRDGQGNNNNNCNQIKILK